MTVKELNTILKDNNIDEDIVLMSDSGWECDPTEMDGMYYSKKANILIFTQNSYERFKERDRLHYINRNIKDYNDRYSLVLDTTIDDFICLNMIGD